MRLAGLRFIWALTVVSALADATGASAQAPYLVKDVNPTANLAISSDPRHLGAGDDFVYFVAQAGSTAYRGFWRTGGTPETTTLILDALSGNEPNVATIGNIGYFEFSDLEHGPELWRTDGTPAGTGLVGDIIPGSGGLSPTQLFASGGLVYFLAYDGTAVGLWRSDGTAAGTIPLSIGQGLKFTGAGGLLYFVRSTLTEGQELWRSDGTPAGTFMIEDTCPGSCSSIPDQLTPVGSLLYYSAYDPTFGTELRVTDGTAAHTHVVVDLEPGGLGPGLEEIAPLGSSLVFSTFSSGLWRSDGTAAGTEMIAPVRARNLTTVGATVFFQATQPGFGNELWHTDGTAGGTAMVGDLCPGPCGFFDTPIGTSFIGSSQLLFFLRYNGTDTDLWRSDGTAAGTFVVKATAVSNQVPVVLGTSLLFAADTSASGRELWRTDGTLAGTIQVTESVNNWSDVTKPTIAGDRLFFQAFEPTSGRDLWVTEGTEATTRLLDAAPGPGHALPQWPAALGNAFLSDIVFALPPSTNGGLWTSDGTPEGTTFVRRLFNAATPVQLGSSALLLASELNLEPELWKSDGTPAGTTLVKDLSPTGFVNQGTFLPALGGTQFLTVSGSAPALWRSDGTPDGTILVAPVAPTEGAALDGALILVVNGALWRSDGWPQGTSLLSSAPQFASVLTAAGGRVFFVASSVGAGRELWATDGTAAGTAMVRDINPGPSDAFPFLFGAETQFVELNGQLYFVAADDVHGWELWRSDGTEAGTVRFGETEPGMDSVQISGLSAAGGRLWFSAYTRAEGRELWTSDGTAAPKLFADIAPGPYSSYPSQFRSDGRRLYFVADDGVHGAEPWALDLPASLAVADVTVGEGDGTPGVASFAVRLSSATAVTATVAFTTVDGSAHAGSDYDARSGVLTFEPGPARTVHVEVPLVGDLAEEPEEAFVLRLTSPVQAVLADADGIALIHDDDAPQVSPQGASVAEGDAGNTPAVLGVALVTKDGAPTTGAKTVQFSTEPGSATAGVDFLPASGVLTFAPGTTSGAPLPVTVAVVGDTVGEDDESFQIRVVATSAVQPQVATGSGVIVDDDGGIPEPAVEIAHGTVLRHSFDVASSRTYRLLQQPHSSYELRLDETSGDVRPIRLERLVAGGTSVVQAGVADGTGGSVVLRWENASSSAVGDQAIRVASAACAVECGPDDTYRLRAYDTTLRGPRFNNVGTQRTVLVLQNLSALPVQAHVAYWRPDGSLGALSAVDLQPRETRVLDTAQDVPAQGGSVTVSHTAGHGSLAGKLVTLEPETGFSFDTPLASRPR